MRLDRYSLHLVRVLQEVRWRKLHRIAGEEFCSGKYLRVCRLPLKMRVVNSKPCLECVDSPIGVIYMQPVRDLSGSLANICSKVELAIADRCMITAVDRRTCKWLNNHDAQLKPTSGEFSMSFFLCALELGLLESTTYAVTVAIKVL